MTSVANRLPYSYPVVVNGDGVDGRSRLAWVLFLFLNATLFMRPAEIVPQLEGLRIYEAVMLSCLALSLPDLLRQLRPDSLAGNAITFCVLGLLGSVVLSLGIRGELGDAISYGTEFAKVVIYYLLVVTLVNSPRRLRQFVLCLAVYALGLTAVALLRYYHVIDLATIAPMAEELEDDNDSFVVRLQAAGIYGNPNDLARIIVVGITVCLFALARKRPLLFRLPWLVPLGVFVHGLQRTYSRGGLLALLAGIFTLFHARFGWKKGLALALVLLPMLVIFGGRQTDIDTSKGTAQGRIGLWSKGLEAFRESPANAMFGIGRDRYFGMAGNHAHNSFIEAYTELGFIGGTLYAGAFYLAVMGLYRLKSKEMEHGEPELWRMRPYVLSLIVGTIAGQMSSSREYSVPTYMILGLASAYLALAAKQTPAEIRRVSPKLIWRLIWVSVIVFVMFNLYTHFALRD